MNVCRRAANGPLNHSKWLRTVLRSVAFAVVSTGLLLVGQPASALQADVCMQTNYTAHGKTQTLTCTANDVRVATATNIDITSGGSCSVVNGVKTCTCNQGGNVTFAADYEVLLTAQARYDIGIYFGVDGDPNGDGALSGLCKLTTLDGNNSSNFINLDPTLTPASKAQPKDVCGDIDAAHNPQLLHLTLTAACEPGPDGKVKLPNCTSWRESGANETCDEATDAFPGAPSKCNCEPGFEVDIFVETATIEVTKTATSLTVPETGGSETYSVSVKNLSQQAAITLDTLTDSLYGDITTTGHAGITATTCTLATINAGDTYPCTFTVSMPAGDAGQVVTDTVTACGTDSFQHPNLCDDDDATVTYSDVPEAPSLTKTVSALNCAIEATYDVVVTNGSAQDTLTLNTLSDDKFGTITGTHAAGSGFEQVTSTTCSVPKTIDPSGNYTCTFKGIINGCSLTHSNTVTGGATDDDGASYSPSNSASVVIDVH
jgi:hypothetical protein